MTHADIEAMAKSGKGMPDGLDSAEQLLFLKFRHLYAEFRLGQINREQGRREKAQILTQFGLDALTCQVMAKHIQIYNTACALLAEANKSDCERCRRLAAVLDGRGI